MSTGTPPGVRPAGSWDPLHELMVLKDRLNHLLEKVLSRGGELGEGEIGGWSPAVDLREDREGFILTAEIPGVPRDSLKIRVEGQSLILEGQRPLDEGAHGAVHLRVERFSGPLSRTIHLPAAIDESKVTARFRLGILEIFLPRSTRGETGAISIPIS